MGLVNLTPHTLNIETSNGTMLEIEPSGTIARVSTECVQVGEVAGIPVFAVQSGEITGLPEPQENVIYVVSSLIASKTARADVYGVGKLIRDESGRVIGARGLTQSSGASQTAFTPQEIKTLCDASYDDGYEDGVYGQFYVHAVPQDVADALNVRLQLALNNNAQPIPSAQEIATALRVEKTSSWHAGTHSVGLEYWIDQDYSALSDEDKATHARVVKFTGGQA